MRTQSQDTIQSRRHLLGVDEYEIYWEHRLNHLEPITSPPNSVQQNMSSQPYVFPASPSPQVKAAKDYLKYISKFDIDGLSGLLTDDFTLSVSPANLGVPDKTRAEEFAFIKDMQAALNGKPLVITVHDVNDGQRKTWIHAVIKTINLEIVYFFQFGKGVHAHKIASVTEFVDSQEYTKTTNPTAPSST